ncbi:MAG: hypothetical protein ABSE93_19600 [Terriglobia bacterium]|jgi:hypothetical protein
MNPVDHYRVSASVAVHKHLAFVCHLHVEDAAFMKAAVTVRESSNQKNTPFGVDLYFTITEFGNRYRDWPAAGSFHHFVHDFLGEGVEHD